VQEKSYKTQLVVQRFSQAHSKSHAPPASEIFMLFIGHEQTAPGAEMVDYAKFRQTYLHNIKPSANYQTQLKFFFKQREFAFSCQTCARSKTSSLFGHREILHPSNQNG